MATTYTTNARLAKPATTDRGWDAPLNANWDALDASNALGPFSVTPAEIPSTTTNVRVAPGVFQSSTNTVVNYAGGIVATPASAATCLWLTDAGVAATGTAFPAGPIVRLALVATDSTHVTGITDQRIYLRSF